MYPSVKHMWDDYIAHRHEPSSPKTSPPPAWYFCNNEADANECAQLVFAGVKRATSPSLWSFESSGEALPAPGDLNIVTDWDGKAVCIIRTVKVTTVPLNEITEAHAKIEGEGDGSLAWWRKAHWDYYHQELKGTAYEPQPDMPIVFQEFERVFPAGVAY